MEIQFRESTGGRSDVHDFLKAQPRNVIEKFNLFFRQMDEGKHGILQLLQTGDVKKIKPHKKLFYLKFGANKLAYRFFFTIVSGTYWILHGFAKKSQKIPKKELATATNRYKLLITNH